MKWFHEDGVACAFFRKPHDLLHCGAVHVANQIVAADPLSKTATAAIATKT